MVSKRISAGLLILGIAVSGLVLDASAVTISPIADTGTLPPGEIAIDQASGDIYVVTYGQPHPNVGIWIVAAGGITPVYGNIGVDGAHGFAAGDGYLFWGNANSGPWTDSQIFRAPESGSGPITAIYTGAYSGQPIFDVTDLAYQAGYLYSVDAAYGRVTRLNSDGTNVTTLTGPSPTGVYEKWEHIALSNDRIFVADATGGYWYTTPGGIYSVPISGGSWTILATGEFGSIAFLNDTIYAIAADGHSIWQVPASGGSASLLVEGSPFGTLNSIAAYNGMLYVTDIGLHTVWQVSFGPADEPPVVSAGDNIQITSVDQAYVTIHATGTDADGDILEYRWLEGNDVLLDWTAVGENGEAYLDLATLPYLSIGDHTLILEVREVGEGGLSTSDSMVLTVQNSPPEAWPAPSSQTVEAGVDPIIVVADIADFDGDMVGYQWLKDGEILDSNSIQTIAGGGRVAIADLEIAAGDLRFPVGEHTVVLQVNDSVNDDVNAAVEVNVIDTTAPSLSPVPSVTILWPPNHELIPVTILANAFDNGGGQIDLDVTIQSSEPADASGDGNTELDFYIDDVNDQTGLIQLRLRSERAGSGEGRTYTITIVATDQIGNQSTAVVEIRAPHDRRRK